MTALPFPRPALRLDARALRRALLAGSAWGLLLAAGFTAPEAWECGGVCLAKAANTPMGAAAAGIVTIGPLAAIGAR